MWRAEESNLLGGIGFFKTITRDYRHDHISSPCGAPCLHRLRHA